MIKIDIRFIAKITIEKVILKTGKVIEISIYIEIDLTK